MESTDRIFALEQANSIIRKIAFLFDNETPRVWDDLNLRISGSTVRLEASFYTSKHDDENDIDDGDALSLGRLTIVRRMIGGKWDKTYSGPTTFYKQTMNGLTISLSCSRAATCRKVATGTREIPETVIPARTETTYDWVCDE